MFLLSLPTFLRVSSISVITQPKRMDAPPPAFPDVRQLTGPNMIGYQLGSALYGVFCLQVFLYWTRYPLDRRWLKIFVAFLLFLETAHTVLNLIGSWYTYGPGFGQLSTLYGILPWSAAAPPIVAAFLTSYVHTFYAHRIWRLTGQWGISVVIMLFTLTQLGFSLAAAIAVIVLAVKIKPSRELIQDLSCSLRI
jgi:hypothetical protein